MRWSIRRILAALAGGGMLASALAFLPPAPGQDSKPGEDKKAGPAVPTPAKPGQPAKPGDPAKPVPPPPPDFADIPGAQLPSDPKIKRKLEAVEDYAYKVKDWGTAAKTIQELLDLPEDVFVPVKEKGRDGKEVTVPVGIRVAANRLLGTLPRDRPGEGLDVYNSLYGGRARQLLQEALAKGDKQLFADVAHRYLYTDAGGEAAERLGTLLLDRGDFTAAAGAFERLVQRDGLDKLGPLSLFKAALAFHRSGDREGKERLWKELADKAADGLRLGDQTVALADLEKLLDSFRPAASYAYDYPQFGGNQSRTAQLVGGPPFMDRRWAQGLATTDQVKAWLFDGPTSAAKKLEDRGLAVLPASFPIAATATRPSDGRTLSLLVFRCYDGVSAVDLKSGKLVWRQTSPWSIERMAADAQKSPALLSWINFYKDGLNNPYGGGAQGAKPEVLLENSTLGSLSTDGQRVYAVDDLAVPPMVAPQMEGRFVPPGAGASPFYNQTVNDALLHNRLTAIELATGKLKWELGGRRPAGEPDSKDPRDFRDSYFLGPPLCLAGRLYLLNEKQQDVRLVCLDPNRIGSDTDADKRDAVLWVQKICTAKDKILSDFVRRTTAAHVAFGEGILVCPTNTGVVLGVDVLSHSLVWAHPYRPAVAAPNPSTTQGPGMFPGGGRVIIRGGINPYAPNSQPIARADWKASAPVIADGRVVFTAPDSAEVRCLNLRSGKLEWAQKRSEDDLYLAGVFAGRAVVVGKRAVRALSLEGDGRELWRVETGMPSGRGVACDNVYYLPLKEFTFADKKKAPGVIALDVEKGHVVSRTRARPDPSAKDEQAAVPGNLVFFDGDVISQNAAEVVAFPQLAVKLRHMDELLAKNPHAPKGLLERGELRLDQGNRLGAVEDLRAALANTASGEDALRPEEARRARAKMFDALTELLQHDFKNGKKFLAEYEALCRVDVDPLADPLIRSEQKSEGQRRRANYLALYAKGSEAEGDLAGAFGAYLEFGALGSQTSEMLRLVDEPAVQAPPEVWARARIAALLAGARPDQREPLEKAVVARWEEARASGDLDRLRHFVALFGSSLPVGREARLHLAERLVESEGKAHLLEAERHLLLLEREAPDPATAARAVEALARLLTRQNMLEDAAHYYRVLRDRYGEVVVRDGKTGARLHQDLATDKRFHPYLEEPAPPRNRRVSGRDESGQFPQTAAHLSYTFEPVGEVLPYFRRRRVAVNFGGPGHLEVGDRRDPDEKGRWVEALRVGNLSQYVPYMANANAANQGVRFGYQTAGHLMLINLGQSLVAFDPVSRKTLWERSLFGSQGPPSGGHSLIIDPNDGTLRISFPDGYFFTLGQAGPMGPAYVCLQTREGLTALDPLTGRTLWTRSDVPSRCRVFGDDEHVYLVEMDQGGQPSTTRAFRARDGAAVVVPNFAPQYQRRLRVLGRTLLTQEPGAAGLTLKMYDIHAGKDLWAKTFPAGSTLLRSEEPDLAGAVAPDGLMTVVDLRTGKDVMGCRLDPKDLQGLQQAHLLSDGDLVYVALNVNQPNNPGGATQTNLQGNTGLRGLSVNGNVYAFVRRTSKLHWIQEVRNQQLVLEQWEEMPVLLFTGKYNKVHNLGNGRFGTSGNYLTAVQGIIKANGKLAFERSDMGRQNQFYAVNNDLRGGKIEMVAPDYKVTFTVEDGPAASREAKAPAGGQ